MASTGSSSCMASVTPVYRIWFPSKAAANGLTGKQTGIFSHSLVPAVFRELLSCIIPGCARP